ncbi:MAG: hypothetical protein AB1757_22240 [Acidobacteriota bacterium]
MKKVSIALFWRQLRRKIKLLLNFEQLIITCCIFKFMWENVEMMKTGIAQKTLVICLTTLLFSLSTFASPTPFRPAPTKVGEWLKQSGFQYKQAADEVWVVQAKGEAMPNFEMLVATNQGVVVIGVVMANKKNLKLSTDFLYKLLKLNHERDFAKIGFDNDDDLFVRVERKIDTLTAEDFIANLKNIVGAADGLYTEIKPYLISQ